MGWNFYNASGELQINDGGVQAASAVFTGNVDLGSNLLVGNAGSTGIAISSAGEVTMAAQPGFSVESASTQTNVTGDGTGGTLVYGTEITDQNADFDGVSTFTAPITGNYLFTLKVAYTGLLATHTLCECKFVGSNRTSNNTFIDPGGSRDSNNSTQIVHTFIMDMDADDTCTIQVRTSNGTKVVDFQTGGRNAWQGWLLG